MRLQLTAPRALRAAYRRRGWPCLLLLSILAALLRPSSSGADAASGTYTGSLTLRGNYYWERSTRVLAPAVAMNVETPSGVRVEGTYLIDAITSASHATGVQSDVTFTEIRNDVSAGLGYELDLGSSQLDLSLRGRFSKEPDYRSRGIGFGAAFSFNQRTSVLSFNGYYLRDDISRVLRMAPAEDPTRLQADEPVPVGVLNALSFGIAWDQVLTPTTTLTVGFDAALLEGYQSNPYRTVEFRDGGGAPENHPDLRVREAVYAWLGQYLPALRASVRVGYRAYRDSWDLLAHAPDVRWYQAIGPHVQGRLRYRYYTQRSSHFYNPAGNARTDPYFTADPKMSAFHNQTLGAQIRIELDFLAFSALDALHTAVIDFGVEYVFNTNRYGNGLIGQGGFGYTF